MNWLERAEQELDEEYENGNLNDKEYQQVMQDLYAEYEDARQDAAREAYDNY